MPLVTQPDVIELSDFSGGWAPDGLNETNDPSLLEDSLNLLLDRNTGSLVTRPGFRRLRSDALEEAADGSLITANHYIKQVFPFQREGDQYLICIVVKDAAEADNVQVFAIETQGNTVDRIDTVGVTWSNPTAMHWHQAIDSKLYGGSKGNPMYRWNGTTWNDDISAPNTKTWVDQTGAGVTTASEYGRDYAFTGKELVTYSGSVYMPNKDIRYDDWDSGKHYQKGDLVSKKLNSYYRSYRCTDDHTAAAANAPDSGGDWNNVWDRVRLSRPTNEDDETNKNWSYVPEAAETSIAAWFADRLFLRFDGQGDNSRLQYSAPIKPDKGQDIADMSWDPNDFAPGNDFKGQGGGWIPFSDGKHGGKITALHPYGQYLIVFKRQSVWVLSGSDDTTWTVRRVARGTGACGSTAVAEVDGLVYFLNDKGLYATDGTAAEEVPGNEKVQQWLATVLDGVLIQELEDGIEPTLFVYDGFIGITLPDQTTAADDGAQTVFYDPETESFWRTDLPVMDMCGYVDDGVVKKVFCRTYAEAGTEPLTLVYQFNHPNADDADDDGASPTAYAAQDIYWYLRTTWLSFGATREMRRIRRVWAQVKQALSSTNFTLEGYRDYSASSSFQATPLNLTSNDVGGYIEGETMPDAHTFQLFLDGLKGGASVLSLAVHTQRRRSRYHA